MSTIAFHTLGCKVNQYDTEAMRESFERAGWTAVDFDAEADVYLINTCTVTATRRMSFLDFWSPVPVTVQVLMR